MTSRTFISARAMAAVVATGALTLALALALTLIMSAGSEAAGATTVQVQPGENLSEIAAMYGTSVAALAAANGIADPNQILIGATLTFPGADAPSAASSGSGGGTSTVTVVIGDTLSAIAANYGVSVSSLAAANGISDPNQIMTGSTLMVPGAGAPATTSVSPSSAPPPTVTVMLGDTLSAIASRYGVSVPTLAAANGISDPNQILIGATLVVPGAGPSSSLPPQLLANADRLALRPLFVYWANQFGIPAALLEAMCWWESGWQSQAASPTGAVGIGQLEPATVVAMRAQLNAPGLNPSVPSDNIEMSAAYLYDLLTETGSTPLALASYYQGAASIQRQGELPSTVQYVTGITNYVPDFS